MNNHLTLPKTILLLVFIHGFRGSGTTFRSFPDRLKGLVEANFSGLTVETRIYPAFETKGKLDIAVLKFADWLTRLVRDIEKNVPHGKAKVVLLGHSMGGLVAADALINIAGRVHENSSHFWPKIIACIAFDSPYLGLPPGFFPKRVTSAAVSSTYAFSSRILSGFRSAYRPITTAAVASAETTWPILGVVAGSVVAGAVVGAAGYYGYRWVSEHVEYVRSLWEETKLKRRLEKLVEIEKRLGVKFRNFYTCVPMPEPRTFIVLPAPESEMQKHFVEAQNTRAVNEIEAHIGMFDRKTNDGFDHLGQETIEIISNAIWPVRQQSFHGPALFLRN